jgi:hypothetical protein
LGAILGQSRRLLPEQGQLEDYSSLLPLHHCLGIEKIKNISLSRKDFKKLKSFTIKTVKYFNVKKAVASVSGRFFYHPTKRVGGERAPFRLHGNTPPWWYSSSII